MGKKNWTKGPWTVTIKISGDGPDEAGFWMVGPETTEEDLTIYVAVSDGDILDNLEEQIANAHLIAAAPGLYNALETLVKTAEARGIPCDAARAEMARARGEE